MSMFLFKFIHWNPSPESSFCADVNRQVISPDKDHDERAKYSKSEDGDVPSQFTVLSSHHGEKSRAEKTCSNRGRNADPRLTIEEKVHIYHSLEMRSV